MATTDIIATITHAGLAAATANPPNANGLNIEIAQAKAYDGAGILRGTYGTVGYVLPDNTVRVAVMVGAEDADESFDLHRLELLDGISGVVFARIRREDNSVIDRIFGRKKSFISYYLKLGILEDDRIVIGVVDAGEVSVALQLLDEHIFNADAHSKPTTITEMTDNTVFNGLHTHKIAISTVDDKGIIETATIEECLLGEDEERAVTPAGLSAAIDATIQALPTVADATTTTKGIVKLATSDEAKDKTNDTVALTPKDLSDALATFMPSGYLIFQGNHSMPAGAWNQPGEAEFIVKYDCSGISFRTFGQYNRTANNGNTSQGVTINLLLQYMIADRDGVPVDSNYVTLQNITKPVGWTSDSWSELLVNEIVTTRQFKKGDKIKIKANVYTRSITYLIK